MTDVFLLVATQLNNHFVGGQHARVVRARWGRTKDYSSELARDSSRTNENVGFI